MRTRTSFVDQIELKPYPVVLLRIGLADLVDGVLLPNTKVQWHRTSFRRDTNVVEQMQAVNAHLQSIGEEPIPMSEIGRIQRAVDFHMQEYPDTE